MRESHIKTIADLLEKEYQDGYKEGIAAGLAVAQRIYIYLAWDVKTKSVRDKLENLALNCLTELKAKLK